MLEDILRRLLCDWDSVFVTHDNHAKTQSVVHRARSTICGKGTPIDPSTDRLPVVPIAGVPELVEPGRQIGRGPSERLRRLQDDICPLAAMGQPKPAGGQIIFTLIQGSAVKN